jgi:hypothetical protein
MHTEVHIFAVKELDKDKHLQRNTCILILISTVIVNVMLKDHLKEIVSQIS